MKIQVYYMSGAGNLFTVINNDNYNIDKTIAAKLAPVVCNINEINKIRTEGLILINSSDDNVNDFHVDFFNPDGSNDAMCGNGSRCAVRFAKQFDLISNNNNKFSMAANYYKYELVNSDVKVYFPPYNAIDYNCKVNLNGTEIIGTYCDVGSKHFVVDFDDIRELISAVFFKFDINKFAPQIRYAPEFAPAGVNVSIYSIIDDIIYLRTYERGVEAQTGACGTGSISTAFSINDKYKTQFPIQIIPPSQSPLEIDIIKSNNELINISLQGAAEIFDSAELNITG